MKTASITKDIQYGEEKPKTQVLLDSEAGKEIRIVFKKGQKMNEHQAPFPITVEIFEGNIEFGVNGELLDMHRGDLVTLDSKVPHNLFAKEDSIVRLSLSKLDTAERANQAAGH